MSEFWQGVLAVVIGNIMGALALIVYASGRVAVEKYKEREK